MAALCTDGPLLAWQPTVASIPFSLGFHPILYCVQSDVPACLTIPLIIIRNEEPRPSYDYCDCPSVQCAQLFCRKPLLRSEIVRPAFW